MENTKIFLKKGREKLLSKMLVTLLVTAMLMSIMPMPRAHAEDPPQFNEISGDITLNGEARENLKVKVNDSATITLSGVNEVSSTNDTYPGIWVPEGSTLTIKGNGTLTVSGMGDTAPAIGGYGGIKGENDAYVDAGDCGDIIIEGNSENEKCTINAPNGIGGGRDVLDGGAKGGNCGDIRISNAILNTEYSEKQVGSIGGGRSYYANYYSSGNYGGNCKNIKITNCVIERVGDIGGGRSGIGGGSCGNIEITKSIIKNSQFIGGGPAWRSGYGSRGGKCDKINIKDSNIRAYCIGAGFGLAHTSGKYGEITISGGSLILNVDDAVAQKFVNFCIGGKTGGPITIKDDAIVYSAKQIGSTDPEEGDENILNVNGKKTVILGKENLFSEDGNLQADEGINRIKINHDDPDSESQFQKVLRRFDTDAYPFISEANRGIWGAVPLPIGKAYFGGKNGTELFMHGEFIELGISNWGDLGTLGPKPAAFRGTNNGWYGSSSIGMSADHDGFKKGNDLPIDYYLPGTPEERFAVGYKDASGSAFTNSNSAQMGDMNMETKVYNLSRPFDGILMAKIVSTWKDKMEITQIISFKESDKFYRNKVTVKNLSGETMENVRYMRSFDPDNTAFQGGDYQTENEILYQEADGSGDAGKYAVVRAQTYDENDTLLSKLNTKSPIFFFSKDANTRVANFGFVNSNPYAPPAYDAPQEKSYSTTSDSAISITHEFEDLSANATSSEFVYYTSLDEKTCEEVIPKIIDNSEQPPTVPTATGVDYNVTFQDYDGNTIETKAMPGGLPVSYIQAPAVAGKVFQEWELVDGDETDLSVLSKDITLKAVYAAAECTVTFDSNGGNFAPKDKPPVDKVFAYVLKDEPVNEPTPPTNADSVFEGWTEDADGNSPWSFEKPITGNKTLYAKWASPVTVTFDGNASGDELAVPDAISVPSGKSISLPSASRDGYEFKGWAETSDGTVPIGDEYTASSPKTLYAIWEAEDFTGTVAIYKNTEEGFRALAVRPEYSDELKAVVTGANNIADLKYQWYRADDADSGGSPIDDAVSESYKVAKEDIDKYLRVAVSVEGQNGEIEAKTSQVKNKDTSGKNYTLELPWGFARDYNFDLSELLPDVDTPSELGNITYSIVSVSDDNGIFSTAPTTGDLSDSNITLSVNNMLESDMDDDATIEIGYASDSPIYKIANSTLTLKVVDKIAIDIAAEMPNRVYDASAYPYTGTPEMTITSTGQGITDELAYTVEYKEAGADDSTKTETAPTNAGTYELIISVDDKGYNGSTTVPFEITKAEMTITVQDKKIYVGRDIPPIDAPVEGEDFEVSGLCGEDTYTSATGSDLVLKYCDEDGAETTPNKKKKGEYSIVGSDVTSDNYSISYVDGKLSIKVFPFIADDGGVDVIVDGEKETIGKEKNETDENGKKKTTIVVDKKELDKKVNNAHKGSEVKVIIGGKDDSTVKSAEFVVENIEKMSKNDMSLYFETPAINYIMRANAVDTEQIKKAFGGKIPTSEIPFNVTISKPNGEEKQHVIENAVEKGLEVLGEPVEFAVTAQHGDSSFMVDRFKLYVTRMIELSSEQADKITTAIVHEKDGSVRHVPTKVTMIDGKYYAKVSSLTNSVYTLIYNEMSFSDAKGTWYDDIASEMASRKIIDGRSKDIFDGDASITRAEFAKMIVNALGLPSGGESNFTDVPADAWYSGYVGMACEYGLVEGRGDGSFDPTANITRQEAMAIIERASRVAEFEGVAGTAEGFDDLDEASSWAKDAIDFNVSNGMIVGYNGKLRPMDTITRAESAAVILRLLRSAELIDNDD